MKILLATTLLIFSLSSFAEAIEKEYTISDKDKVYNFLFHKQYELKSPDCHRQVFESRSPRTMIAMGCELYELTVGPLRTDRTHRWFRGMYQCKEENYPFTANCLLKEEK